MKSQSVIALRQFKVNARTIRQIVKHDPERINEVWCRKIYRQLLQSLERQYAMQQPHRPITPDTVVIDANGIPHLLATISDTSPEIARDLTALARLIYYAITREAMPTGPLRGRRLEGYSNSLISAVDRSMSPRLSERPRTVEQLRDILGIVALRPAPELRSKAGPRQPTPQKPRANKALLRSPSMLQASTRWGGWAIVAAGFALALSMLPLTFPGLRESDPFASRVQPQHPIDHARRAPAGAGSHASTTARELASKAAIGSRTWSVMDGSQTGLAGATAPDRAGRAAMHAPQVKTGHTRADASGARAPVDSPQIAAIPQAGARSSDSRAPDAPPRSVLSAAAAPPGKEAVAAVLHLQIQPWGVVYVDGVHRGVSPPLKRLPVTPGRHSIRVTNPNSIDRVLDVDTTESGGRVAVDFNDQAQ